MTKIIFQFIWIDFDEIPAHPDNQPFEQVRIVANTHSIQHRVNLTVSCSHALTLLAVSAAERSRSSALPLFRSSGLTHIVHIVYPETEYPRQNHRTPTQDKRMHRRPAKK